MKLSFPIDNFLESAANDSRLLPTHITPFMAIFYYSKADDPNAQLKVCRRELMQFSRIKSKSTYHKCISELADFGYITYKPSFDPYKASMVRILSDGNPT